MLPDVQHLMELQQADREILRLNQEVAALPKRVAAIEEKLAGTKAGLEKANAAVKADEATKRKRAEGVLHAADRLFPNRFAKPDAELLDVKTTPACRQKMAELVHDNQQVKENENFEKNEDKTDDVKDHDRMNCYPTSRRASVRAQ